MPLKILNYTHGRIILSLISKLKMRENFIFFKQKNKLILIIGYRAFNNHWNKQSIKLNIKILIRELLLILKN